MAYFEEEQNEQFYLVQEYIEGCTLRDELKEKGNLNEIEVVKILEEVLEILKFLHNYKPPIIHRDIKPENLIRRSGDNKIVLIDFGSVTAISEISRLKSPTTYIYSYGYSPKEQLEGNAQPNSDIYALGVTALEMLLLHLRIMEKILILNLQLDLFLLNQNKSLNQIIRIFC